MSSSNITSYDEIAYDSKPVERTHPSHLAALAKLYGVEPPDVLNCRVLELGCGSGNNLFGLAAAFPLGQFVGIDLAQKRILEGQQFTSEIGLDNIQLHHRSILDIEDDFGEFDFVICHGLFSWVPDEVRSKILRVIRNCLVSNGVAYVSYNSYPGWRIREIIREFMLFESNQHESLAGKITAARAAVQFFSSAVKQLASHGEHFKKELETIRNLPDWYLFHDIIAEINQPFYVSEFITQANSHGLKYLADAETSKNVLLDLPPQVQKMLAKINPDSARFHQIVDFLRNTMFRRTLLIHKENSLSRSIPPESIRAFQIASRSKPISSAPNLSSTEVEEEFRNPNGGRIKTAMPIVKAALTYLSEAWPQSVSYEELCASSACKLFSDSPDKAIVRPEEEQQLCSILLRAFFADLIELSTHDSVCRHDLSKKPRASILARHEAKESPQVTNLHNERVTLQDFDRTLLPLLDGAHDIDDLTVSLEQTLKDPPSKLKQVIVSSLQRLSEEALFC